MGFVLLRQATDFPRRSHWLLNSSARRVGNGSHSFRSPQKVSRHFLRQVSWLGGRQRQSAAEPFRLPLLARSRVDSKWPPSLTVAGPRRFFTGLPCWALVGT